MIQFEEYRQKINALRPKLKDLEGAFDLPSVRSELTALEEESSAEGFWNDVGNSQKVLQRIKQLKAKLEVYENLVSSYEDLETFIELAIEENDEGLLPELEREYDKFEKLLEDVTLQTLFTGELTETTPSCPTRRASGTEAQDWAQMLFRMYTLGRTPWLQYKVLTT